jgi:8-oxo-dGTP pyrophosphatase MutT (NUDIX family)
MLKQSNSASKQSLRKGQDFVGVSVVYFCHDGKGNFVMAKRSKNSRDEQGKWDIGAGGVELGDTIEQTLRKEIQEEYCAEVLGSEFMGYRDVFREHNGEPTFWIALDFKVLVDPAQVKIGEPHKFDALKWFTLETLPQANEIHSQLPFFLKKYQEWFK